MDNLVILDGRNADVFSDGLRRPADCRLPTALQPDLPGYLPVPADPNSPGFLKASRADVCLLTNSAGTIPGRMSSCPLFGILHGPCGDQWNSEPADDAPRCSDPASRLLQHH